MKKRFISIVVGFTLGFSVLTAGCNDAGKAQQNAAASPSAQAGTTSGGKLVVYNNSGSIAGPGSESGADKELLEEVKKWMKENSGFEVEVMVPPPGNEDQKLNMLIASGESIDIFWGKWPEYSSKNVIIPINSYLDKVGPDIKKAWPKESWEAMTDKNGKTWGVPRITPFLGNPLWLRADWLKQLNLEMPKTIEETEAVLKDFKDKKPGGDGTIPMLADIAGKHSSKGLHNTFMGAFTEYGYSNWLDKSDGKIKPAELQPGFKDFLSKMNDWYKKGYIFPEFASLSKDKIREIIKQGKVGSAAVWYSNVTLSLWDLNKNFKEAVYEFPAAGLEGPQGKAETAQAASTQGALISAKSKNPEGAVKMLNFIYSSPENHMVTWYGPEGRFWKWKDKSTFKYETVGEKKGYYAEYAFAIGLPMETAVDGDNAQQARHQAYLVKEGTDLKRAKMPFDAGVVYDPAVIKDKVPGAADITRMLDEETIKFIMGVRPISDYDNFVKELYKAGLDQWIDAYTQMYKEQR